MSTVPDGSLLRKDPSDVRVFTLDWDAENLADGVTIVTSTWTITAIAPSSSDTALTKDNDVVLSGLRKTQVRLLAGTLGQLYDVTNRILTSESPTQTKERSFRVLIENQ